MNESSCSTTSSPAFGIVSVLDFGYSNRNIMVPHFDLQLSCCGGSFYMFVFICVSISTLVMRLFKFLTNF